MKKKLMKKETEDHIHQFELSKTQEEIEVIDGVNNIVRVAYVICVKCGEVKRKYI